MSKIQKICVYCGSGAGTDPAYMAAAKALGKIMAENGVGLVYGGGNVGMMGAVAAAVAENGGSVTGIIPEFLLNKERAGHRGEDLTITQDMHERKRKMFDLADAFVALPGGVGTLEEIVEQMTWAQLGRHKKPILLANINNFWQPLCALLDHMRTTQFIRGDLNFDLLVTDKTEEILPMLQKAADAAPAGTKKMTGILPEHMA